MHISPSMHSASVSHEGGGTLQQSPAKQLCVGGQSESAMHPPGMVHSLLMQLRMSEQSMSEPQRSHGKQRPPPHVQPWLQSAVVVHEVG